MESRSLRIFQTVPVLAVLASAGPASAQAYDDPETEALMCKFDGSCPPPAATPDAPDTSGTTTTETAAPAPVRVKRPSGIGLRRNALAVTVTTEASVGSDEMQSPISLAPDISYGVTDRVTLSLVHSGFGTTGFRGSAGGGLCLNGECARTYNNAGLDASVDVLRGRLAIAAVAGVHAVSFDPMFVDLKVGAIAAYQAGIVTATFAPSVFVGVTERDQGNEGTVFAPASVGAQLGRSWFAAVGGGIATPLADPGSGWTVRMGVIGRYRIARGVFVAASLFLPKLAGGSSVAGTGSDARVANLWLTYNL